MFCLRADPPELLEPLDAVLAPLSTDAQGAASTYTIVEHDDPLRFALSCDGEPFGLVPYFGRVVTGLFWHLDRELVAAPREVLVLLHAAAVELDGKALVLPGASGSGKSTAAARLVADGLRYLTDEITAISTTTLEVQPYPKPIMLERGSWPLFPALEPSPLPGPVDPDWKWAVTPSVFGPDVVAPASPICTIVFPEYREGTGNELLPLPAAEGLTWLVRHWFAVPPHEGAGLRTLAEVVRHTPCYRARYDSLDWLSQELRCLPHERS